MATNTLGLLFSADLGNVIGSFNTLDRRISGLGGTASGVGGAISSAIGTGVAALTTAAVGAGAAIAGGLGLAVNAAGDFESQMSAIRAVSGATAAEMASLNALALQLGADTAFSAGEAAAGFEELIKGGVPVADVLNGAADAMLNLAAAGGVPVATAAEIAANAMGIFGLQGSEMANVADQIAGAANASSLSVDDFFYSMTQAGAVANTMGQTFDDLAVAIAVLGKNGLKGSDAGTSLKTMLMNLQPATKNQVKAFRELGLLTDDGINMFIEEDGSFKSMTKIAEVLQEAMEGLTDSEIAQKLETIFGSDAIRAGAIFLREGAEGFDDMAAAMGKVKATDVADIRLDNFQGSLEQLKGSLETLGITVGTVFLPVARQIVDAFTPLVNVAGPAIAQFAQQAITEFRLLALAFDLGVLPERLATQFGKLYDFVAPHLAAFATSLYDWIATNAGPLIQQFGAWAAAMVEWIAPMIPPLLAELATIHEQVSIWILAQVPAIADTMLSWAGALLGWVATDVLPNLPTEIEAFGTRVGELLLALGPVIWEHGKLLGVALWEGFKAGALQMFSGMQGYFAQEMQKLPAPLQRLFGFDTKELATMAAQAPQKSIAQASIAGGVNPGLGIIINLLQNKDGSYSANAQTDALGSRNLRLALRQQAGLGD